MRQKITLFIAIVLGTFSVFAQDDVAGYYINNFQTRTEGFFKITSFQDTESLEFRSSASEPFIKLNNKDVIEYGSKTDFKFIKRQVKRATNLKGISSTKDPKYITETIFLNVLLEGQFPLYSYNDGNDTSFFYLNPENGEVTQLIYKRYQLSNSGNIQDNNLYKIQIYSTLKCETFTPDYVNNLKYSKSSLLEAFKQLNTCYNSESLVFENKNFKKAKVVFSIYGGAHLSMFKVIYGKDKSEGSSDTQITPSAGAEIAMKMPSGKLDLFARVEYEYFSGESRGTEPNPLSPSPTTNIFTLESNFINILIGPRFNVGRSKNIFLDASAGISFPFGGESSRSFQSIGGGSLSLENTSTLMVTIGAGYKINKRFAVELRYAANRNIYDASIFLTRLSRIGVNVKYSLN